MITNFDSGFYLLLIRCDNEIEIEVGARGIERFYRGYYVYTGSAKRAFRARLSRHLRRNKKFHWHIDYLLDKADITQIFVKEIIEGFTECDLAEKVGGIKDAVILNNRFGSSDCNCPGHLHYFEQSPEKDIKLFAESISKYGIEKIIIS